VREFFKIIFLNFILVIILLELLLYLSLLEIWGREIGQWKDYIGNPLIKKYFLNAYLLSSPQNNNGIPLHNQFRGMRLSTGLAR